MRSSARSAPADQRAESARPGARPSGCSNRIYTTAMSSNKGLGRDKHGVRLRAGVTHGRRPARVGAESYLPGLAAVGLSAASGVGVSAGRRGASVGRGATGRKHVPLGC